jgi:hypothetical protein
LFGKNSFFISNKTQNKPKGVFAKHAFKQKIPL